MWWEQRSDWRLNPELPTLNPWVLVDGPTADAFTYRRNPYCWQVDVEGRQLPYLDEITFTWTDAAGLRQSLVRGEPDVVDQGLSVGDHAWLRDHLDAGTYDVLQCPSPGHLALQLNLSVPDPAKQALVNDRRVRRAVSLLMQRDTLNLFHYDGLLTPRQLAPVTGGRYANDDLAEALVSHDPVEANRLLDEAGYAERDAEGYRLFPDGERIAWTLLEVSTAQVPSRDAELLAEWLADGGIECHPRPMEQWRFMNAWSQNDWDALYGRVDVPVVPTLQRFGFWTGQTSGVAFWPGLFSSAPLPHAIPPPRDHFLWALWGLWEEYAAASTEDERIALWQAALEIWREELPAIGVLGGMPRPVVARKGLRGLDPTALYAEELGGLGGGWLALFHWAS